MTFRTVGEPEATNARLGFERFRENQAILQREWPNLLDQHMHEWVAVFDGGRIVVESSIERARDAVPAAERDTAVLRYIKLTDNALIL